MNQRKDTRSKLALFDRLARHTASVMRPAPYHGEGQSAPFFEGWYFKLVDREAKHPLAIIPGVHLGEPVCFIQVVDGAGAAGHYQPWPADRFKASSKRMEINVAESKFDERGLELHIDRPGLSLRGHVSFTPLTPWPVSVVHPGFMGWYGWAPGMECFHGVVSFDHALRGELELNGHRLSFDGGRGYIEKDWGRSFPKSWIWVQSNQLGREGVSVMGSIARVPWRGRWFPGFGAGVWMDGKLEAFATWNRARTESLEIDERNVEWTLVRGRRRLRLQVTRGPGVIIKGPSPHGMDVDVDESLSARVSVRLSESRILGERVLFECEDAPAGLEVQGDVNSLRPTR